MKEKTCSMYFVPTICCLKCSWGCGSAVELFCLVELSNAGTFLFVFSKQQKKEKTNCQRVTMGIPKKLHAYNQGKELYLKKQKHSNLSMIIEYFQKILIE